ncbi:hypothetical protein [Phenylobacterium sp.]|uniref:hypothetical protein n=1 Tax=Phenylobacterium sp. TaxID=1871053 RepID=UPI0035B4EEAB
MTPMATLAAARLAGRGTPGHLILLDRLIFKLGALVMGVGELFGDKMKSAPDRTVFLGLLASVMSAGIAGAALVSRGQERAGAMVAVATAVPLAYLTLAARKRAMVRVGQTRSGLIEDAMIVAAGAAIVALSLRRSKGEGPRQLFFEVSGQTIPAKSSACRGRGENFRVPRPHALGAHGGG